MENFFKKILGANSKNFFFVIENFGGWKKFRCKFQEYFKVIEIFGKNFWHLVTKIFFLSIWLSINFFSSNWCTSLSRTYVLVCPIVRFGAKKTRSNWKPFFQYMCCFCCSVDSWHIRECLPCLPPLSTQYFCLVEK